MAEPEVKDAPGIGQMLASTSACPEIPHGKRRWKVGHPTQDAKGRLERLVKKVALDEVRSLKGTLDPATYDETFREQVRALKDYDTWKAGWQRIVFDPEYSALLFLWSLLQEHHPEVTEAEVRALFADAPEEVDAALVQVLPDFFQALLALILPRLDPQARAGVGAALAALRERLTRTRGSTSG